MDDFDVKKCSKVTMHRMQTRPFLRTGISMRDVEHYKESNQKKG